MRDAPGLKIMVIPDTQQKASVPNAYLGRIGQYIVDKRPDVVVHIGDHYDMPSLSSYDVGKKSFEGRTYKADIAAGNASMDLLMAPLHAYNEQQRKTKHVLYMPRLEFTLGNHEQRIERAIEADRKLDETIGYHDFNLVQHGWNVNPFLKPIEIGGVHFAHYFYNPMNGRPYSGMIQTRLKNIGFSFVMGHQQGKQQAEMHRSDGTIVRGLIVGSCYEHDEEYLGPQGVNYWRGVVMLHQVKDGNYDLMEVSLDYLEWKYGTQKD
jgi:hypothetical protein